MQRILHANGLSNLPTHARQQQAGTREHKADFIFASLAPHTHRLHWIDGAFLNARLGQKRDEGLQWESASC
jgi:hypothetical protein